MPTVEEYRRNVFRTVFEATPEQLGDAQFIAKELFAADPGRDTNIVATTALSTRLAIDHARLLAELRHTVRQAGEASERLQQTANSFSRAAIWLALFMAAVAAAEITHLIRSWLSG